MILTWIAVYLTWIAVYLSCLGMAYATAVTVGIVWGMISHLRSKDGKR